MEQLAANDAFNKIPATTAMVFFQAAAPTGWTKSTANTDAALRVVSGSGGGTGGTTGFSLHTHTGPSHTHTLAGGAASFDATGTVVAITGTSLKVSAGAGSDLAATTVTDAAGTGASGASNSKYIDVIVCTKDA